ncbi:Succinate-semialdehyde dehydrogenase, mitochondrial [Thelohanellus kitauei]|uniref:Succinate-semialdehyde dehydrogenase, mitochondrial n=1 Tax=Thelohanellus kitauei TaxID=669202 RepID=A0A0C2MQC7_THEKT|nr:Succinate-semialdehyde dehydrogenase, mitochondrial [Thelohanellus kitauei]
MKSLNNIILFSLAFGSLFLHPFSMVSLPRCIKILYWKRCLSSGASEVYGRNFIKNSFIEPLSKNVYKRQNPVDGSETGVFANSCVQDAEAAVMSASEAFVSWSRTSYESRAALLLKLRDLVVKNKEDIAKTMTDEMGKPISESLAELSSSINLLAWFASESLRIHGEFFSDRGKKKMFVTHKPHGVVGLIPPWNFPINVVVRSLGPLLGAGCTAVIKSCPETPLSSLKLAQIIREAGFPPGVVNIITANYNSTPDIGTLLCTHPSVRHISFTGSTNVGKQLMTQLASTVKRSTMELGGNAPAILFKSANIPESVDKLILAKFRNAGQTCISPNRIYVHNEIHDDFVKVLIDRVSKLVCGHPTKKSTQISCLYDKQGIDKVTLAVENAKKQGAKCVYQGKAVPECGPYYYPPTILTNCNGTMDIASCEIFGPVCTIFKFDKETEVFEEMNNCTSGLAAYIYSNDYAQIFRTIEELDFGLVAVNDVSASKYLLPFGGHKESGIGSEMGLRAIYSYLDEQSVVINIG